MFKNKKNFLYKKLTATSLSETLIVMVILGIVSTLSLGMIVADYNKDQTVVRLEKQFYVLSRAFMYSSVANSAPNTWDIENETSGSESYHFFDKYLKSYLILARDCETSTSDSCDFTFKELDGTQRALSASWARFYLNDGTFVALQTRVSGNNKVVYFYVDTNGKRRLNVVGRDIFLFEYWLDNDEHPSWAGRLLPYGHEYSRDEIVSNTNPNNCNSGSNGNYCSALIMKDNWQIIKGYPWAQARYVVK